MKPQFYYAFLVLCVLACSAWAQPQTASTGILKGKVKLQGAKTHEGVLVRLTGAQRGTEPRETKTNEKGEFEFSGLATGEYSLNFERQGHRGFATRRLAVVSGETLQLRNTVEMPKEEPYAAIRGAVLYGVGYSLPNAVVTIERIDGVKKFKQEKVSQEGGEFGFTVKAEKAKYRLTAAARGFQPASQEIEVDGDELRHVALTLQPIQ